MRGPRARKGGEVVRADKRAERLYRTLDAKVRARAVLRRRNAGRKPDPLLLHTMPKGQAEEFNRLVRLAVRAKNHLTTHALVVRQFIPQLVQELDLLNQLRIRAAELEIISVFVRTCVPEPITRQEYRRLDEERRRASGGGKGLPVSTGDDRRTRAIDVRRFRTERTRDVPQLLALLHVSREGASDTVDQGDSLFDKWLDDPPVPMPHAAGYYEVYPDSQAAAVPERQQMLRAVQEILAADDSALSAQRVADRLGGEFDLLWHELRLIEIAADDLAKTEFAGEDALPPTERRLVDEVRSTLIALREELEADGVRVAATEPPEAMIRALRKELTPQEGIRHAVIIDMRGDGIRPPADP
jgi:hypothetical protein